MTTNRVPNQHPSPSCAECGQRVEAYSGTRLSRPSGNDPKTKWDVRHDQCPTSGQAASDNGKVADKVEFPPTPEQQAILDAAKRGDDVVVQAGAGTGKTSTQVLVARALSPRKGQYTAFNSAIVREGERKFPSTVACNTVDSLAIRALPEYKKALDVSTGKGATKQAPTNTSIAKALRIVDLHLTTTSGEEKRFTGRVQVGIAKRAFNKFCQSADEAPGAAHVEEIDGLDDVQNEKLAVKVLPVINEFWQRLQDPHDAWTAGATLIFSAAKKVWQLSKPVLPVDFILFDEAQDASPLMIDVVAHNKEQGKQIIIVGDTQQSINEWAGAVDALPKFTALGATTLFLTKSFRFGNLVADVANNILRRLSAELVLVGFEKVDSRVGSINDPTCILTRTNAGAVRNLIEQIKNGRKPHLAGKNAAKELLDLCDACNKLQRGERCEHPELVAFTNWAEVQDHVQEDPSAGNLKLWVKLIDEVGSGPIAAAVTACVDEKVADVVISTAHKSKGREWESVQIAGDFFPPRAGEDDLSPEELKLAYVAVTRAQNALDISRVPHFTQVGGNGSRFGTDFDDEGWAK